MAAQGQSHHEKRDGRQNRDEEQKLKWPLEAGAISAT
jgi:hypothetical protein